MGLVLLTAAACHRESPSTAKAMDAGLAPRATDATGGLNAGADAAEGAGADAARVPRSNEGSPDAVIRDERDVPVDGVIEKWRLEWRHPPVPECVDEAWASCACAGFTFGERGELDLVRARPGADEERMHLSPLFDDGEARLARWRIEPSDSASTKRISMAVLQRRPVVSVLKLGDYDHDGRATEFVLQVAAYACGHTPSVVVGIDRTRGLHVFASAEQPNDPLTLESSGDWEKVKKRLPLELVSVPCGDHGAEEEIRLGLTRGDEGALHAVASKRPCAR